MTKGLVDLQARLGELPEGKCLAGFSGGADSTAMILMLAAEREKGRCEPVAVHVNHGLRGAESEADALFCREFCEKLHIPLYTAKAELNGRSDEKSCREERYRIFESMMAETGIHDLVLAHNLDDLAETFLMRLMRGAGMEGLACMSNLDRRNGYDVYRPLLGIRREEIRQALRTDGWSWREDSTNSSDSYLRNRIRHRLIPMMEEMAEGCTGRIAKTAEIITDENRLLQAEADRLEKLYGKPLCIDTEALGTVPEGLRKRILRTWWRKNAPETEEHALNSRQTEELAALVSAAKGKVNLPGGLTAVKGKQRIYLTGFPRESTEEIPYLPVVGETAVIGNLMLETSASEGTPGNGATEQEVPADFLNGCVIRTRRPGDRIRPFGMAGSRKLQDYLTDRGIDEPLRDSIPLICRGNEVLLAAGIGAGAVPRWNPNERNVRLKWIGEMSWKR